MDRKILEYKISNIEPKNINTTMKNINTLNFIYYKKYIKYKNKYINEK